MCDGNRSLENPALWPPQGRFWSEKEKARVLSSYYFPFRKKVLKTLKKKTKNSRVVHLSIHTFTPVRCGKRRLTQVGLLFDPRRFLEKRLVGHLTACFKKKLPALRVHRNRPYRGTSDGHVPALRKVFPAERYAGLEVEIRRDLALSSKHRKKILQTMAEGLKTFPS